jgi:hypothetical protein
LVFIYENNEKLAGKSDESGWFFGGTRKEKVQGEVG